MISHDKIATPQLTSTNSALLSVIAFARHDPANRRLKASGMINEEVTSYAEPDGYSGKAAKGKNSSTTSGLPGRLVNFIRALAGTCGHNRQTAALCHPTVSGQITPLQMESGHADLTPKKIDSIVLKFENKIVNNLRNT